MRLSREMSCLYLCKQLLKSQAVISFRSIRIGIKIFDLSTISRLMKRLRLDQDVVSIEIMERLLLASKREQ
jgi:hypothetical protein